MESEDGSIFEISDFTTVTPWESFISDIEKIFHQWGLVHSDPTSSDSVAPPPSSQRQHRKSERVTYAGRTFVVTLEVGGAGRGGAKRSEEEGWPQAMCDLADNSDDFPPKTHCITRWYGVRQFVLIVPDERTNPLHSQAQANLMMSSVSVAIANTGCATPVFIQILDKWRQMYMGVCEGGGLRTTFDMVFLRYVPPQYNHLAGLTELFKAKMRCPQAKLAPVEIAVRLTYVLKHWSLDDWPVEPLGDVEKEVGPKYLMTLPIGAISDPVEELHLSAVWPKLTEELIVDTTSHSDLNPTHAPLWTVTLRLTKKPSCLLAEHLLNFLKLCYREESMSQLLGSSSASESAVGYSNALDRLTGGPAATLSSPLFSSVVYSAHQGAWQGVGPGGDEPLQEEDMDAVMKHLFPDAYESDGAGDGAGAGVRGEEDEGQVRSLRSAPHGSLASLLARALCIVNNEHGLRAFCHVWSEVVKELRYRWENGIVIANDDESLGTRLLSGSRVSSCSPLPPSLPGGPPDMSCCLLHQKLQMLNCCIKHKLAHENKLNTHSSDFMSPNIHSQTPTTKIQPVESFSSTGELQLESEFLTPVSSFTVQQRTENVSFASLRGSDSEDEFYEALESQEDDTEAREDVLQMKVLETGQSGQATGSTGLTASADTEPQTPASEVAAVVQSSEESDSKLEEESQTEISEPTPDPLGMSISSGGRGDAAMTTERVGALKPCGDLVLLATGESLCIPVTQEPPPMTEDMIREQERVLSQLGTSEEAAILRAKMQSSSLVSDMQAFKAANPGALLEDFVRWYSPRDWIEEPSPTPEEPSRLAAVEPAQRDESKRVEEGPSTGADAEDSVLEPEGDSLQAGAESAAEHGIGDQLLSGQEHSPNMEETGSQAAAGSDSELKVVETTPSDQSDSIHLDSNQSDEKVDVKRGKSKFSVEGGDGDGVGEGWGAEWDEDWDLVAGEEAEGEAVEGEGVEGEGVTEAHARTAPELPKRYAEGHLSQRMLQPNNIWVEAWQSATPLPAYKQKRLFDDTREAEKVLHYLAGLRLSDVSLSLIAVLLHSALIALRKKQRARPVATVDSLLQDAASMLTTVQQPTLDALPKYQECIALLSQAEHLLAAAHSLRTKLAQGLELRGVSLGGKTAAEGAATTRELEASAELLLEGPELVLGEPGSSHTGMALQGLLAAQVASGDLETREENKLEMSIDDFPPASGREFILRSTVPRPAPFSHPSPQRLFIVLRHGEFRLAGAFSDDTNLV